MAELRDIFGGSAYHRASSNRSESLQALSKKSPKLKQKHPILASGLFGAESDPEPS